MYRKLFFIVAGMISLTRVYSQTAPIGLVPTVYNSGFAGEAGVPRIAAVSFLNTSYRIPGALTAYSNYVSYDDFFKKIRSGISITVGQEAWHSEQQPVTRFKKNIATIGVSPKFSFKGKYTIAPFIDFSVHNPDRENFTYYSSMYRYNYQYTAILTRAGVLLNSARAYVGVTVSISEKKIFEELTNTPPFQISDNVSAIFQAGYTYQRFPDSDFSFTPQIAITYKHSPVLRGFEFNDISLIGRYKKFIGGLNVPGIVLGYQNERLKFMVSQWLFSVGHVYAGSVGIRYKLKSDNTSTIPFR